ncbi:DUF6161 domain-containing protein [Desulfovibrio cuneatus]|uniref:DUF6161 domain-containing protein n=1 Tax=Desulfovibrio cuneatus TaxID=159728 RepID=UPI00040F2D5E|nr:DUF6161 domain-containing protein [Desulfovibrio cuneatus]
MLFYPTPEVLHLRLESALYRNAIVRTKGCLDTLSSFPEIDASQETYKLAWIVYTCGIIAQENPASADILQSAHPLNAGMSDTSLKLELYRVKQIDDAQTWEREQVKRSLKETYQTAYNEAVGLQAAESDWHDLKEKYNNQARYLSYMLAGAVTGGLTIFIILLKWVLPEAISFYSLELKQTYPLGIIAPFLMITTIFIWLLSFLSKLYVSALHLARDAEEKVVMAKTYFRLLPSNAVTETERSIFFNTMFTPCRTGLIKSQNLQTPVDAGSRLIESFNKK